VLGATIILMLNVMDSYCFLLQYSLFIFVSIPHNLSYREAHVLTAPVPKNRLLANENIVDAAYAA
jgi:hypothetical protein